MVARIPWHRMSASKDIPWFNPRAMDDETVLALSTGREEILKRLFTDIRSRLEQPAAGKHWLVTGPRGAGKSFFLRLVQVAFKEQIGSQATFVLLPEEHTNIFASHEFIHEVKRHLPQTPHDIGRPPSWQVADSAAAWDQALTSLLTAYTGPLLVIGVENFDELMEQAFDDEASSSRLRKLMENEPRLMLVATAVEGVFDEDYEQRMFRQFQHHEMPRWDITDHRDYLTRRARRINKVPTDNQLARIDAYSRFTGGNARVAAVMAGAILDEQDPLGASSDLTATLDRMTDYYRALLERMPVNTRKVFDALVRGGEPASQVEVASRIGARQNDISRAFGWLIDWGYVIDDYEPKKKDHRYHVADRLFVQFYKMRYLQPGERPQLAILTDLLAATIEFRQKWNFAERYHGDGLPAESQLMAELACLDCGVDAQRLPEGMRNAEGLLKLGKDWLRWDEIAADGASRFSYALTLRKLLIGPNAIRSDEAFRADMEHLHALALAKAANDSEVRALLAQVKAEAKIDPLSRYAALTQFVSPSAPSMIMLRLIATQQYGHSLGEVFNQAPLGSALLMGVMMVLEDRDKTLQLHVSAEEVLDWLLLSATLMKSAKIFNPEGHMSIIRRLFERTEEGELLHSGCNNFEAVEAVLVQNSDAPAILRCLCLLHFGDKYFKAGTYSKQLCAIARAHAAALTAVKEVPSKDLALQNAMSEVLKIAVKCVSKSQEGIEALLDATNLAQQSGDLVPITKAWVMLTSKTAMSEGMDAAWKVLDAMFPRKDSEVSLMIAMLATMQGQHLSTLQPAQSFREGVEFFNKLKTREWANPQDELEIILLHFIWQGVTPAVIRDLLAELPCILGNKIPNFSQGLDLIAAWLHHLQLAPDQRAQNLSKLDPDLATTLKSFEQDLSPKARQIYGISETQAS